MQTPRDTSSYASVLREAGLRATPGREQLLALLEKEPSPLTAYEIERRLKGALNQVTVYRALEALHRAKIVSRINFEHDHAHFEIAKGRPHHHHAICRVCGVSEEIEVPHSKKPEADALARAKNFSSIDSYSLEFFGVCKKCGSKNKN